MLFGEGLGDIYPAGTRNAAWSWMGAGVGATAFGLLTSQDAYGGGFASAHPGLVQFAWADGSVRGLRLGQTAQFRSPDWFLLQQLAGRQDGAATDPSSLLP